MQSRSSILVALILKVVSAHSWVEQLSIISTTGIFRGQNGYPRGYVSRSPNFHDQMMTYLLPPTSSGRTRIGKQDILCATGQRTSNQTVNFPRLKIAPAEYMAMKYLENGHVTLPQIQVGKAESGGSVLVFGTCQARENETLVDVLSWSADGAGGDRRGQLLTVQNFDDGRCYQINSGEISVARRNIFPNPVAGQPGSIHEQWCETDVQVPANLSPGSIYTLYWVWQWPTKLGTEGVPNGKDEYYTTCADLDIVASSDDRPPLNPLPNQDPQTYAIPGFRSRAANASNPLSQPY